MKRQGAHAVRIKWFLLEDLNVDSEMESLIFRFLKIYV